MVDEEKLKLIQEAKDKTYAVYDTLRFSSLNKNNLTKYESNIKVQAIMTILDKLSDDLVKSIPDCFQIIASKNTQINNEEKVEIQTNITGLPIDTDYTSIIFDGSIPSDGFLQLSCETTDKGIKFFVENKVPKKIWDEHDLCGYHFCDPKTTIYFSPGVYRIEKGTVIGIGVKKPYQWLSEEQQKRTLLLDHIQFCK